MANLNDSDALVPTAGQVVTGEGENASEPDPFRRIRAAWLVVFSSAHTRAAYLGDLELWVRFLTGFGVEAFQARRRHVDVWARTREDAGDAPRTLSRRLASVSSFYRFASDYVEEEGLELEVSNPAGSVKRPRMDAGSSTRALTAEEYRRLLEAAVAELPVWGSRDAAVVAMLGLGGWRVSTLTAMSVRDLGVQGAHRTVEYTVKGGRRKIAPISPVAQLHLNDHLDARRSLGPLLPREPLILSNEGGRLSRHQVNRILVRCARRGGLADPEEVLSHVQRATYATVSEEAGVPVRDIQKGLDHQDARTTEGYIQRGERLEKAPTYRLSNHILGGG